MVIVIATGNAHKADEIRRILGETHRYVTLKDLPGAIKTREDAETFEGNARKKAFGLAKWLQGAGAEELERIIGDGVREVFVLADDSGLEVDALHGAPGVHSARYASLEMGGEENSTDAANNRKLMRLLDGVPLEQRTARFRCVIAWVKLHAGELTAATFDGVCEGRVDVRQSGAGGFGYDPLFVPKGSRKSFAELSEEEKNGISHRGRALEKLKGKIESDLA